MGTVSSKTNNSLKTEQIEEICVNTEFNNLLNKIISEKIYEKIDINDDNDDGSCSGGIVTRDELKKWEINYKNSILKLKKKNDRKMKKNEKEFNEIKNTVNKLNELLIKKDNEILELEKKIKCMQNKKDELEKNNITLLNQLNATDKLNDINNKMIESVISSTKVDEYVSFLLDNKILNLEYVPDWIEKPIYKNVILIVLNIFDRMAQGATINLLGHRMRVIIDGGNEKSSSE